MTTRTSDYKKYLSWFCWFGLVFVILLMYAGSLTTSIKAGMAFLDWPFSNGSLNPEGWLDQQDQRAEHSHRLLGMQVGLISIILMIWVNLREERQWVRWLSIGLFFLVVLQGIFGGLRVKLDQLNVLTPSNWTAQSFAVTHALTAQITLCAFFTLAVALSKSWIQYQPSTAIAVPSSARHWAFITFLVTLFQILVGAVMRHWDAGLAIPTFPFTPSGSLIPSFWNFHIAIHFLHRVGALLVLVMIIILTVKMKAITNRPKAWKANIGIIHALFLFQFILGATIIWTHKHQHPATFHTLVGALFLLSVWYLNLQLMRSDYYTHHS